MHTSGPSDIVETADGHILVHVVGTGLFRRVAKLIGADDWTDDTRFATDRQRGDHRDELCDRLGSWCADRRTEEALDELANAGLPAGPVLNLAEALAHPQAMALGLLKTVAYPGRENDVAVVDLPVSLSRTPGGIHRRPPQSSEHTDEILGEIGFDAAEIQAFREDGAV